MPNVNFFLEYIPNEARMKGHEKLSRKYTKKRAFYACRQAYNYVSYVKKGAKERLDYVAYSGDSEKSSGVFDARGLLNDAALKELKEALRNTESTIYEGVISFEKEFGERHVPEWQTAHSLMTTEFKRFLKRAGFRPENTIWYAGLHQNTENRHIHFSFFEKEPTHLNRKTGVREFQYRPIAKGAMEEFKIRTELFLTNGLSEIKRLRKELLDSHLAKISVRDDLQLPRILHRYMTELIRLLPEKGRLAYDSANMDHLRGQIREMVHQVIQKDRVLFQKFEAFHRAVRERDLRAAELSDQHKVPKERRQRYTMEAVCMEDLYRRLGNQFIQAAIAFRDRQNPGGGRLTRKHARKKVLQDILHYCLTLDLRMREEAMRVFEEYHQRMEEEFEENSGGLEN